MPTDLTVDRHLEGLRAAMVAFVRYADRAGTSAPVPTCPGWTVGDLVAHQGMVHRWAASHLRGEAPEKGRATERWEAEGRREPDPLEWLRDGVVELAQAVAAASDDLDALVFLADAPPARAFWARRQCHETTMHAVDALAACLGRLPGAAEVDWVPDELAVDGIDELLAGFLPRRTSGLRTPEPAVLLVRPDDSAWCWRVELSGRPPVTTRLKAEPDQLDEDADWELTGTPVELYLRMWNRSEPPVPVPAGDHDAGLAAVRWG